MSVRRAAFHQTVRRSPAEHAMRVDALKKHQRLICRHCPVSRVRITHNAIESNRNGEMMNYLNNQNLFFQASFTAARLR
jgi:hypothetical protein